MMASLTERNFENALKGLFERDEDWCNAAIGDDQEIDVLEIQNDRDGIELMIRFQPVASDLRNVISAMKMSSNLERVADQCVNIARRAKKLLATGIMGEIDKIEPMARFCHAMFRDAVRCYADRDIEIARNMKARDRELDAMNKEFANAMTELMTQRPEALKELLELIFIARFLERIGDLATNMAEDTVYAISAEDIRHT